MNEETFVNSQLEQIANYRSRADENIRIGATWINGTTPVATVIEETACMVREPVVYFSAGVYVDGSLMKHFAEKYYPGEEEREIKLNLAELAEAKADSKEVIEDIDSVLNLFTSYGKEKQDMPLNLGDRFADEK